MAYQSTSSPDFLRLVEEWIQENQEVLVMIRYSAMAGSKDFEFYYSIDGFKNRLSELPSRTCIIAFRQRQLPLRGKVDAAFINRALETLPDAGEWLLVGLDYIDYGTTGWYQKSTGGTHEELRESLNDFEGENVALGAYPPWLEDNEFVVSAVVPETNGAVVVGIY